jgi:hypothetical protein
MINNVIDIYRTDSVDWQRVKNGGVIASIPVCLCRCLFLLSMFTGGTVYATDRAEPATINVGSSASSYATIPFNTYVEDVLPNEWPSGFSWPQEAYKAGAIAVKMYGWYRIEHPIASPLNVYDDTRSQVYVGGGGQSTSAKQNTTPAIALVRNKGMETSSGALFLPQY